MHNYNAPYTTPRERAAYGISLQQNVIDEIETKAESEGRQLTESERSQVKSANAMIGRLRPGLTIADARLELERQRIS